MLEFKVIENLKPNKDLTSILKNFKYKVKLGQIKTILHTNLQVVIPTEYQITYPTTLTILEYKVNEISNKPFYIKKHNQKYKFKDIAQFLKKITFDNAFDGFDERQTFNILHNYYIEKYNLTNNKKNNKTILEANGYVFKDTIDNYIVQDKIVRINSDELENANRIKVQSELNK